VLAAAGAFTISALVVAWRFETNPWLEWSWKALVGLVALQAVVGALAYAGGDRPGDSLHLLYGAVSLGVLPAAHRFSSEAPPRGRAWTFAVAGLFLLLIVWRLFTTGR
jgi:heme A synthase